jgi:hypothetical protein
MKTFLLMFVLAGYLSAQQALPDKPRPAIQRQPTYCDVNSLAPACPGQIQTSGRPPGSIHGLKRRIVLPDGTRVPLRVKYKVDSKHFSTGQPVELEVYEDVIVDGYVVIPRLSRAWATVGRAVKPRNAGIDFSKFLLTGHSDGNGGQVVLELNGVWAITGETIALRGFTRTRGDETTLPAEGGLFAIPFMFLAKGSHAEVPRGAKIEAQTDGNTSLDAEHVERTLPFSAHDQWLASIGNRGKAIVHVFRPELPYECGSESPYAYQSEGFVTAVSAQKVLYCMRDGQMSGGKPSVRIDGELAARISSGSYVTFALDAGEHVLSSDDNQLALDLEAGSEHFLRMGAHGFLKMKGNLEEVDLPTADEEMYTMDHVATKHVQLKFRLAKELQEKSEEAGTWSR